MDESVVVTTVTDEREADVVFGPTATSDSVLGGLLARPTEILVHDPDFEAVRQPSAPGTVPLRVGGTWRRWKLILRVRSRT